MSQDETSKGKGSNNYLQEKMRRAKALVPNTEHKVDSKEEKILVNQWMGENRGTIVKLLVDQILPNPYQPRKKFFNIEELAVSIAKNGLLQPITVAQIDGKSYIVAGERRQRALKLLATENEDFSSAEVLVIKGLTLDDLKILALVENIQREDMTMLETANAYKELELDGNSLSDIAETVGKGKTTIHRYLKIAKQPKEIQVAIENADIQSPNKIEMIIDSKLSVEDKVAQILKIGEGVKVSQIESFILKQMVEKQPKKKKEELFSSAMRPIKKRIYLDLDEGKKAEADKYLQQIVEAKRKIEILLERPEKEGTTKG